MKLENLSCSHNIKRFFAIKYNSRPCLMWLSPAIFTFLLVFMQASMGVIVEPIKKSFNVDSFGIGILSASFFYSYSLFQLIVGSLVDEIGVKKILLISMAGTIISCIVFACSNSFVVAVLSRIFMGLFLHQHLHVLFILVPCGFR